jgi:hypothetical protein
MSDFQHIVVSFFCGGLAGGACAWFVCVTMLGMFLK